MQKLSILIPTITGREKLVSDLVCGLIQQCGIIKSIAQSKNNGCSILAIGFENTEIIIAKDSQIITIGEKRNVLLSLARFGYVVMIDDDDYVYDYYVYEILEAIKSNPDCVATKGIITTNGNNEIEWRLSKDYDNVTIIENGKSVYLRTTNHISPVKKDLALQAGFPNKSNAEDKEFSLRLRPFLKTEIKIDKPLYHYRYQTQNKSYT